MRGIAAVGVAAFHANPTSPYFFWMWSFVDLFFVLSGFLIGTILYRGLSSGTLSLKNFWIRRILRLWPVYYLTLSVVMSWALISPDMGLPFTRLLQSLFFMQFTEAYLQPDADWNKMVWGFVPWFSHSWSIAVEEQFYLLLPPLIWVLGAGTRSIVLVVVASLVFSELLLQAGYAHYLLGTRMQGLALGLLLVPLSRWLCPGMRGPRNIHRFSALSLLAAGFVLGLWMMTPRFMQIFSMLSSGEKGRPEMFEQFVAAGILGMSLIYFAVVGFILAFPHGLLARILSTPPLVYLGAISYALYMLHVPIGGMLIALCGRALSDDGPWINLIYWVAALGAASLSRALIENRFDALKARYPVFIKSA